MKIAAAYDSVLWKINLATVYIIHTSFRSSSNSGGHSCINVSISGIFLKNNSAKSVKYGK